MKRKVLVVDDDHGIVTLMTKALTGEGYAVDSASDGVSALELATGKEDYSLIISDIVMQQMGGLEFFESLKKVKSDTPIILVSGYTNFEFAVEALNLGAVAFLVKPFDISELLKWVDRVMNLPVKPHARELLFELCKTEMHELVLDTASLVEKDNLSSLAGIISELFMLCKDINKVNRIKTVLAIHEALRNSVEHGNLELPSSLKPELLTDSDEDPYRKLMEERLKDPKYGQRKITLKYYRTQEGANLTVRDEGNGFDHRSLLQAEPEKNCHGRGLLLMRTGVDEVSYNESGNEVTLSCFISE